MNSEIPENIAIIIDASCLTGLQKFSGSVLFSSTGPLFALPLTAVLWISHQNLLYLFMVLLSHPLEINKYITIIEFDGLIQIERRMCL